MNITQQQRQDLTLAVVAGEHQIDADCIRLHRDPTQEGSALSQLVDRVVAVIEQSTAQPQAVVPADQRPVNCGTGYCSCIECVVEPTAQAERAPVVQAVQEAPAVRMLTEDEQAAIIDLHNTGRAQGDHECVEAIQRKFCAVNAGRTIPPSGEIGGA